MKKTDLERKKLKKMKKKMKTLSDENKEVNVDKPFLERSG